MSPPDAPSPFVTALGWPRYSSAHADAPAPPDVARWRQSSLPLPTPSSEPANRSFALDTWMAGSPAVFVPQPLRPTVCDCSWPVAKLTPLLAARPATGRPDAAPTPESPTARPATASPTNQRPNPCERMDRPLSRWATEWAR